MKTTKHILIMAAAAVVALASCQKNELQDGDGIVRYAVDFGTPETPTKGTLVNTTDNDNTLLSEFADIVGSFDVKAYNGSSEALNQTVTWSGGAWTATPTAYWPQQTSLSFLACANLPAGQTASITSAGVTTAHSVPAAASAQTDILFGHYQGNGGNTGTARIRFEHPLTAVRFLYGTITGNPGIKSISLGGIAQTGTATMDAAGTISWSGVGSHNYTVSQTGSPVLSVVGTPKAIGEPFIIIPQNLATDHVTVLVTFDDDTDVEATLTSGEWLAGETNAYTLQYDISGHFTLEVTPWGTQTAVGLDLEEAPEFIDLGLPSGKLWADRNIGASSPEEAGLYFAFGDITGYRPTGTTFSHSFDWSTAPFNNGNSDYDPTYFSSVRSTVCPGDVLAPEYDAAHVILGDDCCMPTKADYEELIANTNVGWTTDYKGTGIAGYVCTSRTNTSKSIFLPAAGVAVGTELTNLESGYIMSSSLDSDNLNKQWYIGYWSGGITTGSYERFIGRPVRAVIPHGYVEIGGVKWATMNVGATTVAGDCNTCFGDYFAWGETEPYYISYTPSTSKFVWKTSPKDYSSHGYNWKNYALCGGTERTLTKYCTKGTYITYGKDGFIDNLTFLEPEDDAATANWGSPWRTPKKVEFQSLCTACTGETKSEYALTPLSSSNPSGGIYWLSSDQHHLSAYTGVAGILFVDQSDNSKMVFFPAGGYLDGKTNASLNLDDGFYWCSTIDEISNPAWASVLQFEENAVRPKYFDHARCRGALVRAVHD